MSTTTRNEVRIDTHIVEAMGEVARTERILNREIEEVRRSAGQHYNWKTQIWDGTWNEAFTSSTTKELEDFTAASEAFTDAVRVQDEWEQKYTGWSRFFLVTNIGGHIHKSLSCSTCFSTTQYAWLPQLSGLTEADAVAAEGEILCSVCFPSAPAEWTNGTSKADQAARAARQHGRDVARAKKAAKAINADLSPLRIEKPGGDKYDRETITTISAAKARLTDTFDYDHLVWMRQPIAETLAFRLCQLGEETTPEAQIEAARVRHGKRR